MTVAARITQDDWIRAAKSVKKAGIERARIIGDLKNGRIEIIIGESGESQASPEPEPWDDDDI